MSIKPGQAHPTGAAAVVFPVVFFSALAGVVACSLSLRQDALYLSPRIGFRAGLIATLVGSGGIVLAATLAQFGLSTTVHGWGFYRSLGSLLLPPSLIGQACFLAALSIPPSLVFGVAGAFIVGFLRLPPLEGSDPKRRTTSLAWSVIFRAAVITAVVCYLSPFALALRPKPKPITLRVTPTPVPIVKATPVPEPTAPSAPPPPKWRYEKPSGFDEASAGRIDVVTIRPIAEVNSDQPFVISPNGRLLAFAANDSDTRIVIHDLDADEAVASFSLPFQLKHLVWSPEANRLFFISRERNSQTGVLDMQKREYFLLPLPETEEVPSGKPLWFDTADVLFLGEKDKGQRIDLENLTVTSADVSRKWKELPKQDQDNLRARPDDPFAIQRRWKHEIRDSIKGYKALPEESSDWDAQVVPHLALGEPKGNARFFLPQLKLQDDDRVMGSPDGTKLVRIRGNNAETIYFGLREQPVTQARLKIYSAPDDPLKDALNKKTLAVFICPPVKNPLNDRTVGPNRGKVKAIGRILTWTSNEIQLWIEEAFETVSVGDVAADIHRWEGRSPIAVRAKWWAAISEVSAAPLDSESDFTVADRGPTLTSAAGGGASAPPSPRDTSPTLAPSRSQQASTRQPVIAPANPAVQNEVGAFLANHHAKSSRNDIEGVVTDYTDRVDHFDKGVVDRNFIRKEETDYRPPGYRISERIVTPINISVRSDGAYEAAYTIAYERVRPDGRWARGLADLTLRLATTPEGFRINYQRATHRNQQKGP